MGASTSKGDGEEVGCAMSAEAHSAGNWEADGIGVAGSGSGNNDDKSSQPSGRYDCTDAKSAMSVADAAVSGGGAAERPAPTMS
jgi:hypothetical protein